MRENERGAKRYVMEFKMILRHAKIAPKGCENMRIVSLLVHNLIQNNAKKYSIVRIICIILGRLKKVMLHFSVIN